MKICLSAGEVSGDNHAAHLVKELKLLRPDIYFFGLGGEKLAAEGVDIKFDITRRGSIGILEVLPNLFPILSVFAKMKGLILQEKPDLVILVDSQGFNLPLANFCKQKGIKTVYYIAPQEWLWGTPAGVKKVAKIVDLIVAIFKKEYEAYKQAGANVIYFGHPLLDIVRPAMSKEEARAKFLGVAAGIERGSKKPIIGLCPGSRTQELKHIFPILLKTAELIQKEYPDAHFLIPAASQNIFNNINAKIRNSKFEIRNLHVFQGFTYDALSISDLALCVSGTINLEASILGIPNIMVYKLSWLTYFIGKYILHIDKKIRYFSMPNILLDERVLPELVMSDAVPEKIAANTIALLKSPEKQKRMEESFEKLRALLGSPGALLHAARSLINFIER